MRSVMVFVSAKQFPEKIKTHAQNGTKYRNGPLIENCLVALVLKRLIPLTPDDEV
jgi:hypothetical protein